MTRDDLRMQYCGAIPEDKCSLGAGYTKWLEDKVIELSYAPTVEDVWKACKSLMNLMNECEKK